MRLCAIKGLSIGYKTMQKRIMALDVGDARVGVAISDPLGITSQPHSTVEAHPAKIIEQIIIIAVDNDVGTIVVGLPYELDGAIGEQAKKVQKFVDNLIKQLDSHKDIENIPVEFIDERLTTQQAKRVLAGSRLKNKENSAALDKISAAIILETYMNTRLL